MLTTLDNLRASGIDFTLTSDEKIVSISIGTPDTGLAYTHHALTMDEIEDWLFQKMFEKYPNSEFVKFYSQPAGFTLGIKP